MRKIYRNVNLLIFLTGLFLSGVGTRLTTIALSDKVFKLSGSDFNIAMVFLLQGLPVLLLGFIAGNLIDKQNKKTAMIAINLVFACTSLTYVFINQVWILDLIIFSNGILMAFYNPIRVAILPLLVDDADLMAANGLRMSINGVIMIIGFAVGGILVHYLGNSWAFIIDSISFTCLAFIFLFLRPQKQELKYSKEHSLGQYKNDLKEGWNFVKDNNQIKEMVFFCVMAAFVLQMQLPLTFIFAKKYFGGAHFMAQQTGFLFSALGIGVIVGGILLGYFKSWHKLRLLAIAIIFDGSMVLLFAINRNFYLALVIFATLGIISSFTMSIPETIIQQSTPVNLIGRVSGFVNSIVEPVCVLSILVGGLLVRWISVDRIFAICGGLELFVGFYFIFKYGFFKGIFSGNSSFPENKEPVAE